MSIAFSTWKHNARRCANQAKSILRMCPMILQVSVSADAAVVVLVVAAAAAAAASRPVVKKQHHPLKATPRTPTAPRLSPPSL